jgi:hypothetical protein
MVSMIPAAKHLVCIDYSAMNDDELVSAADDVFVGYDEREERD